MMTTAAAEVQRVASYIEGAEHIARSRDTSRLSRVQSLVRGLLLDELARYRRRYRFPKHHTRAKRMPIFIDHEGTRCAMAHLMELGGAGALVAKVASEQNLARVSELAALPGFLEWLDAAGLSSREAARIQPEYDSTPANCVCGGAPEELASLPQTVGVVEAVVGDVYGYRSPPLPQGLDGHRARVIAIHGSAPGIMVGAEIAVALAGNVDRARAAGKLVLVPVRASPAPPIVAIDPSAPEPCIGTACPIAAADGGAGTEIGTSSASFATAIVLDNGVVSTCGGYEFANSHPLSKDQVVTALTARDCRAALVAVDADWGDSSGSRSGSSGCAAASENDAARSLSVSILLALVTAIAARRYVSARSRA